MITRREFLLKTSGAVALTMTPFSKLLSATLNQISTPPYLAKYSKEYLNDPHQAAIDWFRNAKFGLFMHYGLYSLLGKGAWVQFRRKIPVKEYAKLKNRFTASAFNADFITDTALKAGMKYVNITTKHHDGFCLFKTSTTNFNSYDSPAKRDLVGELAAACAKKGLGLCLYYSHGRDWHNPDAPNNDEWGHIARPHYSPPDPTYHVGAAHDLNRYLQYVNAQLRELLTNYGPIASIWFDGYDTPAHGDVSKFHLPETYRLIRSLQKECLISYKLGFGGEDYYAVEKGWLKGRQKKVKEIELTNKPMEVCTTMGPGGYAYLKSAVGKHFTEKVIWNDLVTAANYDANLLLDTGLRPDGSIDPVDVQMLGKIGARLRKEGFPKRKSA